jgi:hypothetical protein
MSLHPPSKFRGTPLWAALGGAIAELAGSREIVVNTAPDYVIDYLCRELVAKRLVVTEPVGDS